MSDALIAIKDPNEEMKNFNKRLRDACANTPVTDFELHVVDGQPMVVMFSGLVEADEDDVEEAKEASEELKLGDLIPEDDPVVIQVCQLRALVPMELDKDGALVKGKEGDAALTEKRLDTICERANDGITKVRVASGTSYAWVVLPGKDTEKEKKREWLPVTTAFTAIAYINQNAPAVAEAPAAPAGG